MAASAIFDSGLIGRIRHELGSDTVASLTLLLVLRKRTSTGEEGINKLLMLSIEGRVCRAMVHHHAGVRGSAALWADRLVVVATTDPALQTGASAEANLIAAIARVATSAAVVVASSTVIVLTAVLRSIRRVVRSGS